jgi:hypothetical protein
LSFFRGFDDILIDAVVPDPVDSFIASVMTSSSTMVSSIPVTGSIRTLMASCNLPDFLSLSMTCDLSAAIVESPSFLSSPAAFAVATAGMSSTSLRCADPIDVPPPTTSSSNKVNTSRADRGSCTYR